MLERNKKYWLTPRKATCQASSRFLLLTVGVREEIAGTCMAIGTVDSDVSDREDVFVRAPFSDLVK